MERNREGNGDPGLRRHPMRYIRREIDSDARPDREGLSDSLHCVEITLQAIDIPIELSLQRGWVILKGSNGDVLYAPDLQQEAVLDIEVHGSGRSRTGDEQIP